MEIQDYASFITNSLGNDVITGIDEKATPNALLIAPEKIKDVCRLLHEHEDTFFDFLSCITGIDNGPEKGTLEIAYNLYSIPYGQHLMLKIEFEREIKENHFPSVPSVISIWRSANWHEREIFDLLGVYFTGHPDMRRILLPADWEGHPLRKDYVNMEKYHGVTVKYEKDPEV